jgi:FSR family fosmidomycin resistance protein-like MFS transporter
MASGIALGVGNALGALAVFVLGFVAAHYGLTGALWCVAGLALLGLPLAMSPPERSRRAMDGSAR